MSRDGTSVSPHVPAKRELKVTEALCRPFSDLVSPHVPAKRELKVAMGSGASLAPLAVDLS
jgi:hypothetical protein